MTRCSISLLLLLAACPAAAQPASPSTALEALVGAREALAEGSPGRAFEMARIARAFDPERSLEAYALMGRAQSELGDAAAAHRFFRRALELASPDERGRLLARMQLERDEFGIVVVDVQPGGAELFVDGQRAELERGETLLVLRPGTREIVARMPGHEARRTSLHVAPGSHRTLHIVLPEGDEGRTGSVPGPTHRHPGQRWLTGNLMMIGLGALGMGVAGSGLEGAHPSVADELQLEVGIGLGLVLGSSANMLLSAELEGRGGHLFLVRFGAFALLAGAALPVAVLWGANQRCPAPDGETVCLADQGAANTHAAVAGTLLGMAVSTFSNLGLSFRDVPVATSMAATFFGVSLLQIGLAVDSLATASSLRLDAAEMQGQAAVDAYESAAAHGAVGEVAGTVGLVFLGMTAASAVFGILGDSDELDITVAAGPGTVSVSGVF